MLTWHSFSQLAGGLGLFLLGMWLLTEGLKLAGGNALQSILASWTVNRLRSFLSGFTLTAIVQSSSAVTLSIIGFINAGLLDLSRSVWVIFGSNVGTTMTAWIVALIGFKFKIDAAALPAIGLGAILHLFSSNNRWRSFGGALAGLGLLFLGLQLLQNAFEHLGTAVDFSTLVSEGPREIILMLLMGLVLTAAMQSSSAAMAIVLTAVATEVISLSAGAAAVIGANIGTTITAIIAVLKATANARRVACAHVIFNLVTALVALTMLGLFLSLIGWLQDALGLEPNAAVSLALFHTVFNLLGVLLMIPIEPRMTRWLLKRFTKQETIRVRPKYLDKNIISIPDLALNAVLLDQQRSLNKFKGLLQRLSDDRILMNEEVEDLKELITAINEYVVLCAQQSLSAPTALAFQQLIHTNSRLINSLEELGEYARRHQLATELGAEPRQAMKNLLDDSIATLDACLQAPFTDAPTEELPLRLDDFEQKFHRTEEFIIEQVRLLHLTSRQMENLLREIAALRTLTRQSAKACAGIAEVKLAQSPSVQEAIEETAKSAEADIVAIDTSSNSSEFTPR